MNRQAVDYAMKAAMAVAWRVRFARELPDEVADLALLLAQDAVVQRRGRAGHAVGVQLRAGERRATVEVGHLQRIVALELRSVAGTPFDFTQIRAPRRFGRRVRANGSALTA